MGTSIVLGVSLIAVSSAAYITNRASHNIEKKITIIPKTTLTLATPKQSLPSNFLSVLNQSGPYAPMNLVILGSDTRAGQGKGFGNVAGARSDTAMLMHLNATRTRATIISFPRDLWVTMPACTNNQGGSENKFNAIFAFGGPGCTETGLTNLTGIPIDHVVVVDFNGFKAIVDSMGGLNVCLAYPVNDDKAHINLPAGKQKLNGVQALGLARARYSLADGSDLQRIKRQQAMVLLAAKQLKASGIISNPTRLYDLSKVSASSLSVDPGLATLPALAGLAWQIKNLSLSQVQVMTVPYIQDNFGHYVINYTLADPIFQAIISDTAVPGEPALEIQSPTPSSKATGTLGIPNISPSPIDTKTLSLNPGSAATPTPTPILSPLTKGVCAHPLF